MGVWWTFNCAACGGATKPCVLAKSILLDLRSVFCRQHLRFGNKSQKHSSSSPAEWVRCSHRSTIVSNLGRFLTAFVVAFSSFVFAGKLVSQKCRSRRTCGCC